MLVILALWACAKNPADIPQVQTGGPEVPSGPAVGDSGLTESPFTAAQLRAGFPIGTVIRLAIREMGKKDREERWEITAADDIGITIASTVYGPDGAVVEDEGLGTSTWEALREHAVFPAAQTIREDVKLATDMGEFDCWLYTVVDRENDTVKRLWLAKTMPGPPLLFTIVAGKGTVFEMQMKERVPRPSP